MAINWTKAEFKAVYGLVRTGQVYLGRYYAYVIINAAQYAVRAKYYTVPSLQDRLAAYKVEKDQMMRDAIEQWELAQY